MTSVPWRPVFVPAKPRAMRRHVVRSFGSGDFEGFVRRVAFCESLRNAWRGANGGIETLAFESRRIAERLDRRFAIEGSCLLCKRRFVGYRSQIIRCAGIRDIEWQRGSTFSGRGGGSWPNTSDPNIIDIEIEENTCSLAELAPLEAVLFDIDGTLCDTDPIHYYAFREMLLDIGYNNGVPIDEEFVIKNIAGGHNEDIARRIFPDWDHEKAMKFMDDKEEYFRKLAREQLKAVNGLHKLCKWIDDHGIKRAAVTNAPRPNAELMISLVGLTDFFQVVVVGSECERAKPFPDPYLKALEGLNVSRDHTFVFEDSPSGIKAGVAAGLPVIGLPTRNPEELLTNAGATFLIKDYDDPKLWNALEELEKAVAT